MRGESVLTDSWHCVDVILLLQPTFHHVPTEQTLTANQREVDSDSRNHGLGEHSACVEDDAGKQTEQSDAATPHSVQVLPEEDVFESLQCQIRMYTA